jgi:hypothetical protein
MICGHSTPIAFPVKKLAYATQLSTDESVGTPPSFVRLPAFKVSPRAPLITPSRHTSETSRTSTQTTALQLKNGRTSTQKPTALRLKTSQHFNSNYRTSTQNEPHRNTKTAALEGKQRSTATQEIPHRNSTTFARNVVSKTCGGKSELLDIIK